MESQIRYLSNSAALRGFLTDLTTLSAEFANQVSARVTVLAKQYSNRYTAILQDKDDTSKPQGNGDTVKPLAISTIFDGRQLATSDYLRDSSPTAFLHLYDWYNATSADRGDGGDLSAADRVRVAKRLFSDRFWTKINEAYASGQGEVSMAFIKDDLGNWNLKSFSNDPTELLSAYRQVGVAAMQTVVKAAGVPSASDAKNLKSLFSQFSNDRLSPSQVSTTNSARIDSLRQQVVADLTQLSESKKGQAKLLKDALTGAQGELDRVQTDYTNAENAYNQAVKYLTIYSGTFWLLISLGISWHIPEKMVQNFRPGT